MTLLEETLSRIRCADTAARETVRKHIESLTMPRWALGRVLDLAVDLAGITRDPALPVARKEIILMAGDHGIVREGVCPQPSSVTEQMVRNFVRGGGAINVLAGNARAHVTIVDVGVDADLRDLAASGKIVDRKIRRATGNFAVEPAMSREEARASVEAGIALVLEMADKADVFATGEMGIGNTSPSTAILTVLAGKTDPAEFVGRGAGLAPEKLRHKAEVIHRGILLHRPDPEDGLDLLSKVGGLELGGIAGVILGAASIGKPVIVDGFCSSAGALIAAVLSPDSRDSMILAHGSAEPGHRKMQQLLGKTPLLDLEMRLGEGTGAALAMNLLDAASAIVNQMATFESASVTDAGLK